MSYELHTADTDMAEFLPSLKAELPQAVPFFDPDHPNYVYIVPADFYYAYYAQKKTNKIWDAHKVGPSYDFPGGQAVKELRSRLHHISKALGVVGLGVIIVGTIVVFAVALPAAAGVGAVATTGTTAGAGVGAGATAGAGAAASLPITSTIVAPASIAAKVAASAKAAAAASGVTAGLMALPMAATVQPLLTAGAGVVLIIGTVNNAQAGTGRPDKPVVTRASAFRAVAIADFKPLGAMQSALSAGPPVDFLHTPDTARDQFNVGTKVLFDNVPHIIIAGFSAS